MRSTTVGNIRYLIDGSPTHEVEGDNSSRRNKRDEITFAHEMSIKSARKLFAEQQLDRKTVNSEAKRQQLQEKGFCKVGFRSKVASQLTSIQNPIIYRNEKTPETELSRSLRTTFVGEVQQLLKALTGAKYCFSISHACRFGKRNPTGVEYLTAFATFAHCDFTTSIFSGAPAMVGVCLIHFIYHLLFAFFSILKLCKRGVHIEEAENLDYAFFNVWQPVEQDVYQHPLALLDWTTVNSSDIESVSLGYKVTPKGGAEGAGETQHKEDNNSQQYAPAIAQLYHNSKHQWFYYPQMKVDEMLVFTQCDSR